VGVDVDVSVDGDGDGDGDVAVIGSAAEDLEHHQKAKHLDRIALPL
jgi:hypothetical protein